MTEQQQIAMIRTLLYFVGKQMYTPSASNVAAIWREAQAAGNLVPSSPPLTWDIASNKAPSSPPPTWNLAHNISR